MITGLMLRLGDRMRGMIGGREGDADRTERGGDRWRVGDKRGEDQLLLIGKQI